MSAAYPILTNFTGGEFTPRLRGRVDFDKYYNSCATLKNMVVHPHGGATRRPGTYFVSEVKDSSKAVRVIPFEFSTEQAYIIEVGDQYMRFYKDNGQILAGIGIELIANGEFDESILEWDDLCNGGSAAIAHDGSNYDLNLTGDGTYYGWAEQVVDIVEPGVLHILKFDVIDGAVKLRVGSTSGDDDVESETEYAVGSHAIFIDPADNDALYVQFRHSVAETRSIDNVSLKKIVIVGDGAFEEWASATDLHLWTETVAGSSTVNREATEKHGGTYGLKVSVDASNNDAYISQNIALAQTVKYTVSVWYKNSTSGKTSFLLIKDSADNVSLKSDGTWEAYGAATGIALPNATDWTQYTLTFEAHASYSAYVISLGNDDGRCDATSSDIYFDDLTISHPCEIATPYLEAEIFELSYAQSADTLFLAHYNHKPRKLLRFGHYDWSLVEIEFIDGPYHDREVSSITPSGTSGEITLTADESLFGKKKNVKASSYLGKVLREPTSFNEEYDVGRLIRMLNSGDDKWYWGKITEIISNLQVKVLIMGEQGDTGQDLPNTYEIVHFRMGYWSDGDGWPATVAFYEQRLWWGDSYNYPQTIWASCSGDFENMCPSEGDHDALELVYDNHAVTYTIHSEQVNHIRWMAPGNVMFVGTHGSEFMVRSSGADNPITPDNVQIKRETSLGSAWIRPVSAEKTTFFVQRTGRQLRGIAYDYEIDGYVAHDMTLLAEHLTEGGLVDIAYQQIPDSIIWAVRGDGLLLGMTYQPRHEVIAWHWHETEGDFEAVTVIPVATYDQLWTVVKRNINSEDKRYIEYFKPMDWGDDQEDCFFVDCGLTYDGEATDNLSGADHLATETAAILADGASHSDVTIGADGTFSLNRKASVVHAGFAYESILETMPLEPTGAQGYAQSRRQRINEVVIRFYKTLGCQFGRDADNLDVLPFGPSIMDEPPPLFTGKKEVGFPGISATEAVIYIKQDQPLPLSVLGIYGKMELADA